MDSLGTLVLLSCHWGIDVDPNDINYVLHSRFIQVLFWAYSYMWTEKI